LDAAQQRREIGLLLPRRHVGHDRHLVSSCILQKPFLPSHAVLLLCAKEQSVLVRKMVLHDRGQVRYGSMTYQAYHIHDTSYPLCRQRYELKMVENAWAFAAQQHTKALRSSALLLLTMCTAVQALQRYSFVCMRVYRGPTAWDGKNGCPSLLLVAQSFAL